MKEYFAHRSDTAQINDRVAAKLLSQIENVTFLRAFMREGGNTVAAVAEEQGLTPNAAFRKVKRLEALGLLRVIRTESRKGRAIQVYGSPAQRYFVPAEVLSVEEFLLSGFEAHFAEFGRQLRHALAQGSNPVTGLLVLPERESSFGLTFADNLGEPWNGQLAGSPKVYASFTTLELDYAAAVSFDRDLRDLITRYRAVGGSTNYMFGLFMTPAVDAPPFAQS